METALSFTVAVFFAVSIYMMMSKNIIRIVIGVGILSNAVNLLIFTAGRVVREVPPIIPEDALVPVVETANRFRKPLF